MKLRIATITDSDLLYAWRMDAHTQAMSLGPGPATRAEHDRWLTRVLADPAVRLYIVEVDGHPVGTGRLNLMGREAEVSLTVAPEARGQGYGSRIVAELTAEAGRLGKKRAIARVRGVNKTSLAAFLRGGYVAEGTVLLERSL